MLLEKEDAYIEYLKQKKIQLEDYPLSISTQTIVQRSNSQIKDKEEESDVEEEEEEESEEANEEDEEVKEQLMDSEGQSELDKEVSRIRKRIKDQMKRDKDLVDKSQNAFVSFVRYYKEHTLRFIFQFNLLDLGAVANSFYLFRIPRVKEILGKKIRGFEQETIDLQSIPYTDKNKAKQKESTQE